MYSPHLLYVKTTPLMEKDEFGRTKRPESQPEWKCVGACRCDDASITEVTSDNGEVFRPSYHIVCDNLATVKMGDVVRVLWLKDYSFRAEGVVRNITTCNFLDYKSIYL